MTAASAPRERTLILAPRGRDAVVAKQILHDAQRRCEICLDLVELLDEIKGGAELAIVTEEELRGPRLRALVDWVAAQPPWSDFPFVILTRHGGGLERNPGARELTQILGNVTLLERPFHPTTLVSIVETSLRSRRRQYESKRLNEELEWRVAERTQELAAANRQLLNQIEERERVEATLFQMQRLEAVGQLTSGVAHDFNNLLTVILSNAEFLEQKLGDGSNPATVQRLKHMRAAAERGAKLTDQLLSFSRRQRLQPQSLDLNDIVLHMRDLLESTMGGSIKIETRFGAGLWQAMADPTQVELAVLNLAINARDAMRVGGTLTVGTANARLGPPLSPEEPAAGDYVAICVADTGSGMTHEVRKKAFEPFFTTKEIGKGSGLGLSQVLGFAKQSNGGVRIASRLGEGTQIHIYLPRTDAKPEQPHAALPRLEANRRVPQERILVVDDDDAVREIIVALLRDLGYSVAEAGSGGAALEIAAREPGIDLMIADFAMPGMNGAELARQIRATRPSLPILFVTGFADRAALGGIAPAQIIAKPFTRADIANRVLLALAPQAATNVVRLRN